ncbi:MAG: DUF4493 domain-containing protein [Bacteroidales bacterium]|nr:DUF4493 domain-containing protein [Bacteroidales bacterium]
MKKILTYLALGLALAAVSCTKADLKENGVGMGVLSMDMSLSDQTKAMSQDELLNTAQVKIYKADFSGLVRSYAYSNMPSPFYLAADAYRVDVVAGEAAKETPAPASFENKSYKGSKEFTITAGNVTNVEVVAGLNNAVTNISFDQTVADNFSEGYTFTIGLDAEDAATQLVYNASNSGSEGYFIVAGLDEPSFTWTFSGVLAKDGSAFTKTGVIEDIVPGKLYKMNLKYTIKDGDLEFTLVVDYTTDIVDDTIVFEPVSTGLAITPAYEIWAAHATVYADVDPNENAGATVQFAYSTDGGSTWEYADGVNYGEGVWKADLTGLTPSTEYTYALAINGEHVGNPLTFTTEAAPALPNSSFEYVSKVSGKDYYKFYDPNCGVADGSYMFWGSGNGEGSEGVNGSANMGIVITTIDTGDKIDGNQSVLCQNNSIVGMLTAGNLFTGQFAGLVGTSGGKVNFGRPWTSRPSALKIWAKYTTGQINILKNDNLGVSKSDYDRAQIKVAIGTWDYKKYGGTKDSPVHVNTTDASTFVDFYTDESTIANGDLIIYNDGYMINNGEKVTATTSGWIEYIIPLDYRQFTTYPTHIVISCATSQFGDYFTGYDGGRLWIDAAELIYE